MNGTVDPIRVLFVDDNILAATALERWFASCEDIRFVGWAENGGAAVAMARSQSPEIVLLDLEMPGVDTLALIPQLLAAYPKVHVVVLSGHLRSDDIGRALDAGATGYIAKDEPTATISALVRRAAQGECVLSPLAQRAYLGGH